MLVINSLTSHYNRVSVDIFPMIIKILLVNLILLLSGLVYVNAGGPEEADRGEIHGIVTNAETGAPVGWVSIYIEDLNLNTHTHEDGDFRLTRVPEGTHYLVFQRVGYTSKQVRVEVEADEVKEIEIELEDSAFQADMIEVRAHSLQRDEFDIQPEHSISGSRLRQALGQTIAETLDDEPGLAQRSMGPAPARPVLRGLGGDRLLILEDGGRTGDLSATAADHALAIEPMTAEEIELIRGPSTLTHGSNTLGGVINVRRGQIPTSMPEHHHGSMSAQGESVNRGTSGGFRFYGPLGEDFAYRTDASIRNALDTGTPVGTLDNTDITTYNASVGGSWHPSWGMAGVSANFYDTQYGVPGGEGIASAHPSGVDIEMYRYYFEGKSRIDLVGDFARRLDLNATYSFYHHKELEYDFEDRPVVGSEFGVLTTNLNSDFHYRGNRLLNRGIIGGWYEHRDYATGGDTFPFGSDENAFSLYAYQDWEMFRQWNLESAIRYDYRIVTPSREGTDIDGIPVNERRFGGFSASLKSEYNFNSDLSVGFIGMRSYQAPGIEELFSEGPHLAVFRFEVGNPQMKSETGLGTELFFRYRNENTRLTLSAFRNQINDYIHSSDTGEPSDRRPSLNVYRYDGGRALMHGFELNYEFRITEWLIQSGVLSYVRGEFIDEDDTLPFLSTADDRGLPQMPPLNGRLELEYQSSNLNIGGRLRFATEQDRVDEFETPTDGHVVGDFFAQYHFDVGSWMHTVSLNFENVANTEYRQHLSQIREIMPEPGRNVNLLYRLYF